MNLHKAQNPSNEKKNTRDDRNETTELIARLKIIETKSERGKNERNETSGHNTHLLSL